MGWLNSNTCPLSPLAEKPILLRGFHKNNAENKKVGDYLNLFMGLL